MIEGPTNSISRRFRHLDRPDMWRASCHMEADGYAAMDIARPEFKRQKLRRQIVMAVIGVVVVVAATVGIMRLRPAAPTVERGTVYTDTVKHGALLRQGGGQ